MFKNYLKVAYRNLLRKKMYAVINIFGLSTAIACCIVAYLNYDYSHSFDAFHENAASIYRVESLRVVNGIEQRWGMAPLPLGPALAQDFPAVERVVRIGSARTVVRSGENVFNENVKYIDPNFFEMFSFPLKFGNADVLKDRSRIVLSGKYAEKYFGDDNPIGKPMTLRFPDGQALDVVVGAVAYKYPLNSSIRFDILASSEILVEVGIDEPNNWAHWNTATFVQISDPVLAAVMIANSQRYVAAQNAANLQLPISGLHFEPLRDLALTARSLRANGLDSGVPPSAIVGPSIIAVLLLLMACFNYMNTAIAFSANRLKEIGVRKVVGGMRKQLIGQFMGENLLLCVLSLTLAVGLAELLVPGYNAVIPQVELKLDYSQNFGLLLFLAGLLLFIGVAAGAYPAFYISSYQPVNILKGKQLVAKTNLFMRVLLSIQFGLSMMAVAGSLVFAQNARYQKHLDLGYNRNFVVVVPIENERAYTVFRNAIASGVEVESVAGSRHHTGYSWYTRTVKSAATELEAEIMSVGVDYLATMQFHLAAGRPFDRNLMTDATDAVIINQKMANEMSWDDAIGKTLTLDESRFSVIGVVDDFYNDGPWRPIEPAIFRLSQPENFRYVIARINSNNLAATSAWLRDTWKSLQPDAPYDGFFQDDVVAEATMVSEQIYTIFNYVALIAIAISAMGLFALVSMTIARRTKEIGVRKVLGASVTSIVQLVNREFVILLIAGAGFGNIAGYYAINLLLGSIYAYHITPEVVMFALANLLVFVVAAITVGAQVLRVARANPVLALRYE